MKNRISIKVNPDIFSKTEITEEVVIRQIAVGMVKEMPIEDLVKMINLTKTNISRGQSTPLIEFEAKYGTKD